MTLSQQFFSKPLTDLTYSDLVTHFNEPQEESDRIEYKSFRKEGDFKKKEAAILKTICAFLNSGGGQHVAWEFSTAGTFDII